MTKDLSKQICEKCGIPHYEDYLPSCGEDVLEDSKILDFGEPSNFVKLLELQIEWEDEDGRYYNSETLNHYLTLDNNEYWFNRKDFLRILYNDLITLQNQYPRMFKCLTKAIREAEWKYE